MKNTEDIRTLYRGLRTLSDSSFPKECMKCGSVFESARQFFEVTQNIGENCSGLHQSRDDDGNIVVGVCRNCICGSTLKNFFGDRRDESEAGQIRRRHFIELLDLLINKGMARDMAKDELIKFVLGQENSILQTLGIAALDQ